jgi:hypothetical protein
MISFETPFDVQSNITLLTPAYTLCSVVMLISDHSPSCSFTCIFCEIYSPCEVVFCYPILHAELNILPINPHIIWPKFWMVNFLSFYPVFFLCMTTKLKSVALSSKKYPVPVTRSSPFHQEQFMAPDPSHAHARARARTHTHTHDVPLQWARTVSGTSNLCIQNTGTPKKFLDTTYNYQRRDLAPPQTTNCLLNI